MYLIFTELVRRVVSVFLNFSVNVVIVGRRKKKLMMSRRKWSNIWYKRMKKRESKKKAGRGSRLFLRNTGKSRCRSNRLNQYLIFSAKVISLLSSSL